MKRTLRWFLHGMLPLAGAALLVAGLLRTRGLPGAADLAALAAAEHDLTALREVLQAEPPPSADELLDRLPRTVTAEALLRRIERAARAAGVQAISFGTQDEGALAADVASDRAEPIGPEAERLACEVVVEAEFTALVRFLGLLETATEATRVRSLLVVPLPQGVHATVGLDGFAYAGDGLELSASPGPEAR